MAAVHPALTGIRSNTRDPARNTAKTSSTMPASSRASVRERGADGVCSGVAGVDGTESGVSGLSDATIASSPGSGRRRTRGRRTGVASGSPAGGFFDEREGGAIAEAAGARTRPASERRGRHNHLYGRPRGGPGHWGSLQLAADSWQGGFPASCQLAAASCKLVPLTVYRNSLAFL